MIEGFFLNFVSKFELSSEILELVLFGESYKCYVGGILVEELCDLMCEVDLIDRKVER